MRGWIHAEFVVMNLIFGSCKTHLVLIEKLHLRENGCCVIKWQKPTENDVARTLHSHE